jgi:hypothetical protein
MQLDRTFAGDISDGYASVPEIRALMGVAIAGAVDE